MDNGTMLLILSKNDATSVSGPSKCTTFEGSDTHSPTFLKRSSNITNEYTNIMLEKFQKTQGTTHKDKNFTNATLFHNPKQVTNTQKEHGT